MQANEILLTSAQAGAESSAFAKAHSTQRPACFYCVFVISNLPALALAPSLISCGDISTQLPYQPHVPNVEGKSEKAEH